MKYELWVNDERTVLVRRWENGHMEVCARPSADHTWGPPIDVKPEPV